MTDWKKLKEEIDQAANAAIEECPADIRKVFQFNISPNGGGTGGLMFADIYESAYSGRYLCAYYMCNIIKLANARNYSLKRIKQMLNLLMEKEMKTVRLSGLSEFADFTQRVIDCVNEMDNREDALMLMNSLYLYGAGINAWQNYMFPWGLNSAFLIPTKDELAEMGRLADQSFI